MQGDVLTQFAQTGIADRMSHHGSKIAKVQMDGSELMARAGSMIAYEGLIDFNPNPPQLARMAKSWATGEGVPLMICSGQGELYLADYGAEVIILQLNNEAISVNGKNILAFDAHLQWGVERVKNVKLALSGGGMFNVVVRGQGWVALTSHGKPVMLDTREAPTYVDTDALVAWTEGLQVEAKKTVKARALIGQGSGEAFQLGFQGQGFVVVQPSEDPKEARSFIRG